MTEATRAFMYGKLHRVTVTNADIDYVGSVTIDALLLGAAGIYPHTMVDVVNVTTGERIQTYAIEGPAGGGDICLNGAAAHKFRKGDLAIVMAYEQVPASQLPGRVSRAVHVDDANRVVRVAEHVTPRLDELGRASRLGERYERVECAAKS